MGSIYESDIFAALPDSSMHPGGLRLTQRAVRLSGLVPGMHAADLGCGVGASTVMLAEKFGLTMVGVERADVLVKKAQRQSPGVRFICADCSTLPFDTDSLDGIFMECSLSLMDQPEETLRECARSLKPSGRLIISEVVLKTGPAAGTVGPRTADGFLELFSDAGFCSLITEDHTNALRTFVAELYANTRDLNVCAFFGGCCNNNLHLSQLGYMLFILEK